jgi:hypothetical protein
MWIHCVGIRTFRYQVSPFGEHLKERTEGLDGFLERFPEPVLENVFGTISIRGHRRFARSSVKFLFNCGEGGVVHSIGEIMMIQTYWDSQYETVYRLIQTYWDSQYETLNLRAQVIQEVTAEGEQLARASDGREFKILELESHKDLGAKFVVSRVRESGLQVIRRLGRVTETSGRISRSSDRNIIGVAAIVTPRWNRVKSGPG